jgi:hypothetical protein
MPVRSAIVFASLVFCLGLGACASSGGGGAVGVVSVSPDGVLTRGGGSHTDLAFVYADRGCKPFAIDGDKVLDILGDPQKIVRTNDYIGTAIYAVPPGAHTLTVRSTTSVDGQGREAFPVTPLNVQARHFYGIDCVRDGEKVDVQVSDRDHLGSRND